MYATTWIVYSRLYVILFFFQAEDGIRDVAVTGVQTCALPIYTLQRTEYTTRHPDLGPTCWYAVRAGDKSAPRGAWQHIELPTYASELRGRVAFAWPAMDAFYEEDERIMGHAADSYLRIDIRQASRNLVVHHHDRVVADTKRPIVQIGRAHV